MKSLKDFIIEAQENNSVKNLFIEVDEKLKDQKWNEVAPLIESIFKNKWGKPIKLDDNFSDKMRGQEYLLLGYNAKAKSWVIAYYNKRSNNVYGALYDGYSVREIGRGPEYWSNVASLLKDEKMKLKFGDISDEACRPVIGGINASDYNYR